MDAKRITLIGVGLIGGSLALDLKRQAWVQEVTGIDTHKNNLSRALERNVIDHASMHIEANHCKSDLIIIATPVATIPSILKEIAPLIGENTIITDVGSTKALTLDAFKTCISDTATQSRCVAAHPIAGSDRSGAQYAVFGLFENKKLIICPHETQDIRSLELVSDMWACVGADIHFLDAQTHDHIFSTVSHLPHLLAYAFMHQIAEANTTDELLQFAASGFRDFTRIAASHPEVWTDIFLANQAFLVDNLDAQIHQLQQLKALLKHENKEGLYEFLVRAKAARDKWQDLQ